MWKHKKIGRDKRFWRASHQRQKLIRNVFKHIRSRKWLDYVIKLICTPREEHRGWGIYNNITHCPGPPRPIWPSLHRDHHTTKVSSPEARGSQRPKGKWESQSRIPRECGTSPGSSQGCPQRTLPPVSRLETHHKVSLGAALQTPFDSQGSLSGALGHTMGKHFGITHASWQDA